MIDVQGGKTYFLEKRGVAKGHFARSLRGKAENEKTKKRRKYHSKVKTSLMGTKKLSPL